MQRHRHDQVDFGASAGSRGCGRRIPRERAGCGNLSACTSWSHGKFVAPQRARVCVEVRGIAEASFRRPSPAGLGRAHRGQDSGRAGNSATQARAEQFRTAFSPPQSRQSSPAQGLDIFLRKCLNRVAGTI